MRTVSFFRRTAFGAAIIGAAILATLPVRGADKRIVLIAGRPSHPPGMHEFRAGSLLLQKALSGVPGVKVDVYDMGWPAKMVDGARTDDSALLEGADAILIYSDGERGHPALQGERMKTIDALAAKGAGLGFAHYAVDVAPGVPGDAFHRWLGGHYERNWSVNPMWKPDFQKFPTHPITRGVGPFATHDEWYFNMRWTPDEALAKRITPILVSKPSDEVRKGPYVSPRGPYEHIIAASGRDETMMWTFERPDGGRSFGFTGGHTHANWGDVNQRRVMLNALLWMAKVEVPDGGVKDAITPEDLTKNLDEKPPRK